MSSIHDTPTDGTNVCVNGCFLALVARRYMSFNRCPECGGRIVRVDDGGRVKRGPAAREPAGVRVGPHGHVGSPTSVAIGFCALCGENARNTSVVRGEFRCPSCTRVWYDTRVGTSNREPEDNFVAENAETR